MKQMTSRRQRIRGAAVLSTGAAMFAGLLLLPAAPAHAADPASIQIWGSGGPTAFTAGDQTWTEVFDSKLAGTWLVATGTGDIQPLAGADAVVADLPAAVDGGQVVDANVTGTKQAWAVLADGTVHKWGATRAALPNQSWSTSQLGGRARDVEGTRLDALVTLTDGSLVRIDGTGAVAPVTRDGTPVTGVKQVVSSNVRLSDGSVGEVDVVGELKITLDSSHSIVDLTTLYAVGADGAVYQWSITGYSPATNLPTTDTKPVRAVYGDSAHSMLLTDSGEVVVWRPASGGSPASAFQVPATVEDGVVAEVLDAAEGAFAVWVKPDTSGDPVTVATPAAISGSPVVGETLTATPATFAGGTPDSVSSGWFVGETPLDGAEGESYTITEADLGSTITYRTVATKAGYDDVVSEASAGPVTEAIDPVTSTTHITLAPATGAYGTSRSVAVRVNAGGATPTGSVTVTVSGSTATADLVDGQATVALPMLGAGKHALRADYSGDEATAASSATAVVAVAKAKTKSKVKSVKVKKKGKKVIIKVDTSFPSGVKAAGKTKIVVKRGAKTVAKKTVKVNKKGIAKLVAKKLTKKGKYKIKANYAGDTDRGASKAAKAFKVR